MNCSLYKEFYSLLNFELPLRRTRKNSWNSTSLFFQFRLIKPSKLIKLFTKLPFKYSQLIFFTKSPINPFLPSILMPFLLMRFSITQLYTLFSRKVDKWGPFFAIQNKLDDLNLCGVFFQFVLFTFVFLLQPNLSHY